MKKRILFLGIFLSSIALADKYDVISSTVEKYKRLGNNKALAVAVDESGTHASSWAYNYSTRDKAIASALKRCKKGRVKYSVQSECVLYMVNNQLYGNNRQKEIYEKKDNFQSVQKTIEPTYTQSEIFSNSFPIPKKFLVKTSSGCGALNPNPEPNESIKWTGKCVNGRISGFGTLTWYKNGKKGSVYTGQHYKNGFALKISRDDFSDYIITSSIDKECQFVMPNSVAYRELPISKLMDVKFHGGCGKGYQNKVSIYFNNALFAVYRGKMGRGGVLPVEGELEYFSGDVYKMGKSPWETLLTGRIIRGWYDAMHLVRSGKAKNGLSDSDFKIKLGFNTKPSSVKQQHGKIIGFNVRALSSSNDIILNYNIKPKNRKKLTKKQYKMVIEIKMDYTKTGSFGIFSMSEDKQVYDYVEIILKRSNGYKAYGKNKLRKMSTFQRGLGVNITKTGLKPTVRVVSID